MSREQDFHEKKRPLLFLLDSNWDFVREISNLTLQVLKPGGKFFAQVIEYEVTIVCSMSLTLPTECFFRLVQA